MHRAELRRCTGGLGALAINKLRRIYAGALLATTISDHHARLIKSPNIWKFGPVDVVTASEFGKNNAWSSFNSLIMGFVNYSHVFGKSVDCLIEAKIVTN